jgi:hypothetical protein
LRRRAKRPLPKSPITYVFLARYVQFPEFPTIAIVRKEAGAPSGVVVDHGCV